MTDPRKMTASELRDEGYLQEVNRRFFHPLGLAMFVDVDSGEIGVFDDRGDVEGWYFASTGLADDSIAQRKYFNVRDEQARRLQTRVAALGDKVDHKTGVQNPPPFSAFGGSRRA